MKEMIERLRDAPDTGGRFQLRELFDLLRSADVTHAYGLRLLGDECAAEYLEKYPPSEG